MSEDQLTVTEAAMRVGVTPRTVRLWLTSGRLAGERVRGHFGPEWRVSEADVGRLSDRTAEAAIVSDPLGKLGGNEFRASLALLFQENAGLQGRLAESGQHLARLAAHVERLAATLEEGNAQLEALRAENQELLRAAAEATRQRQRESQELQVAVQGLSGLLHEDRGLLQEIKQQVEGAARLRLTWWQRVFPPRGDACDR